MKNYSTQQRIQIAGILSKSNPQSLPYILDVLGIKQKADIQPPKPIDDSVSNFLLICGDVDGKFSKMVYSAYRDYCESEGANPLTHIEFSRQFVRATDFVSANKRTGQKVTRIFKKGDSL